MIFRLVRVFLCILLIGCERDKEAPLAIDEVKALKADEEKRLFLEKIHELQHAMRKDLREAEATYGRKSKETGNILMKRSKTNELHLSKIVRYLKIYGHPSISIHGRKACRVPSFIMQFSREIALKEEMFPYLYEGYLNGDIRPSTFSRYLNSMHRIKFGERFTLPNPYREENLIKVLMERLDLKISAGRI